MQLVDWSQTRYHPSFCTLCLHVRRAARQAPTFAILQKGGRVRKLSKSSSSKSFKISYWLLTVNFHFVHCNNEYKAHSRRIGGVHTSTEGHIKLRYFIYKSPSLFLCSPRTEIASSNGAEDNETCTKKYTNMLK
jgi:hypothetical protein